MQPSQRRSLRSQGPSAKQRHNSHQKKRRRHLRLALESLEPRQLLASDLFQLDIESPNYVPNDIEAAQAALASVETNADATPVRIPETPQEFQTPEKSEWKPDGPIQRFMTGTEFYDSLGAFREDARFAGVDGSGFSVVVIDSGADLDHPHFGPDADENGIADRIVHQQSFTGTASADDDHGHGTHVLGITAGGDESLPGVATGSGLIALKVLGSNGRGSFGSVESALQWVIANAQTHNIASVNMSLGDGSFFTEAVQRYGVGDEMAALAALDVLVVSSSGNSYSGSPGVGYPSADPNSLSIGSERTSGGLSGFSQRDPEQTTVFAPGQVIRAAWPGGGTRLLQGTSMASPQVAGVAALAQDLAADVLGRRLTNDEFIQLLRMSGPNAGEIPETGSFYPGVNVLSLGEEILAMNSSTADLEVTQLNVTGGASRGAVASVEYTITNNGSGDASESLLDLFLSRNDAISWTGDFKLSSISIPVVPAGATHSGSVEITLPAANDSFWDTDTGYTLGTVIDAGFAVPESNEVNNLNAASGNDTAAMTIENLPRNLLVDDIAIVSSDGLWGGDVEISFNANNVGGGPSQPVSAQVYLSKDATIVPESDLLLGSIDVPRIDGGQSLPLGLNLELPEPGSPFWTVAQNEYFVGVFIDSSDSESESDEDDNLNRGINEDIVSVPLVPPPSNISGSVFVDSDNDGQFIDRFDDSVTVTHTWPGQINPNQAQTRLFTGLPEFSENATLTIRMLADIGAASRNLSVRLDNDLHLVYFEGDLPEGTGVVLAEQTIELDSEQWANIVQDGEVLVSADVNFSGRFTTNSRNFIEAI
ncbi:MAG: S8 family serine peptidase, partial [Planctomycetota bacterium]